MVPVDATVESKSHHRHQRYNGRDIEFQPVHGVDVCHSRQGKEGQKQNAEASIEEPAIDTDRRQQGQDQYRPECLHAALLAATRP